MCAAEMWDVTKKEAPERLLVYLLLLDSLSEVSREQLD